jgi:dTMP kinase
MLLTTIMRAGVVATLPFVNSVLGLVFASLLLEMAALLFQPAKEATVPNLVPADRLASSNSLGLAAAYGTFPLAGVLFGLLAKVAQWLGSIDALDALETSQEAVAFYAQVVCYLGAALIIARLSIPRHHIRVHDDEESIDLGAVFTDIKDGWHFAFVNPVVRGVNLGLATGLIAGGMLIPLGQTFSRQVLGAGTGGYGAFIAALGLGVGAGIIGVSARQSSLPRDRGFVVSVFGAGIALLVGVSVSTLELAALAVIVMGAFTGSAYVLGFTLLHENVDDELRGRVFSGTYILVRMCVLISMAIGPLLVDVFQGVSKLLFGENRQIDIGGFEIAVPGVRLTLWLAGIIMLGAGALAARSLRDARTRRPPAEGMGFDGPNGPDESETSPGEAGTSGDSESPASTGEAVSAGPRGSDPSPESGSAGSGSAAESESESESGPASGSASAGSGSSAGSEAGSVGSAPASEGSTGPGEPTGTTGMTRP